MLSDSELIFRLFMAAVLGSAIGFERERQSWAAGLRTHMLVSVGSCLVMIVSAFGFADILGTKGVILDPSRMAAQVVSGIGFLGAGAILLRGEIIRGLTTAASVWAVAGVGLAVGGGLYLAAIASTLIILLILAGIRPIEDRYRERRQNYVIRLQAMHGQMNLEILREVLGERIVRVRQFIVQRSGVADIDDVTIILQRMPRKDVEESMEKLRNYAFISDVKEDK